MTEQVEVQDNKVLSPQEVMVECQKLIAENLKDGNSVKAALCGLVGDIMVNGFRTEQLDHRVDMQTQDGSLLTSLITLRVEVFQKVKPQSAPAESDPAAPEVE